MPYHTLYKKKLLTFSPVEKEHPKSNRLKADYIGVHTINFAGGYTHKYNIPEGEFDLLVDGMFYEEVCDAGGHVFIHYKNDVGTREEDVTIEPIKICAYDGELIKYERNKGV